MKPAVHQYEDKLLELAYGELAPGEATAVESHVRTCTRCTEALSEIRAVRSTMGQLPSEPVPEAGLESLFAYADQAARRNAAGPAPVATWWRKLMAPLLAAGALSVIGIVAYQSRDAGEPLPTREQVATAKHDGLFGQTASAPREAAVAAAEPERFGDEPASAAQEKDAKLERTKNGPAKALAAEPAPKPKQAAIGDPGGSDMLAKAKRSESKKRATADDDGYDAIDNSIVRGGKKGRDDVAKEASAAAEEKVASSDTAKQPEPVAAVPAQAPGNAGGAGPRSQAPAESKPAAPPPPAIEQQQQLAESGTQVGGASSNSFGLGIGSRSSGSGSGYAQQSQREVMGSSNSGFYERESRDEAGRRRGDSSPATAAAKPADLRSRVDELLKQARAAKQSRDTQTEVQLLKEVLDRPAPAAARLEALNGICNGLQTLGLLEQAAPYCQKLVSEYPDSRVAREWVERQNRIQRPAKRSKAEAYDDALEPARPPPQPAQSAPSKAY